MAKTKLLSIHGDGFDVEYREITEKQAKTLVSKGISFDELQSLLDLTSGESGPTEVEVFCENTKVAQFSVTDLDVDAGLRLPLAAAGRWYLIKEEVQSGEWGFLSLEGEFDKALLRCKVGADEINGHRFKQIYVTYNDRDFELGSTSTSVQDLYLLAPDGTRHSFEVIDD